MPDRTGSNHLGIVDPRGQRLDAIKSKKKGNGSLPQFLKTASSKTLNKPNY